MLAYLAGLGIATAASAAAYQTMAPTGQWYGRAFCRPSGKPRTIALTYDVGPNVPYTLQLLELLARQNVKATFFLIGRFVRQRPAIVREVLQAGHAIGNHTFNHPLLIFQPASVIRSELNECQVAIEDTLGQRVSMFRPPFGGRRPAVFKIARELGLQPVLWSVTGYDWNAKSAEEIETKVVRQVRGGEVVLLHDGGHRGMGADRSRTLAATDSLIARYKSQGFEFLTIPAMVENQSLH